MKIVIDIPEELHDEIIHDESCGLHELTRAVAKGTTIPENATNGDMIKAMFSVKEVDMSNTYCVHFPEEVDYSHYFFKDWWNAPYYNNK